MAGKNADSNLKRKDAVEAAKRELVRRNLPLPKDYVVKVSDSFAFIEFEPTRRIYIVSFAFKYRGKPGVVYEVNVDKRSGKVDDVTNLRTGVPLRR